MPVSGIYDMTWHDFPVRAWNFLQNGIQNFVFWLIHSEKLRYKVKFSIFKKKAQKKALALKGLIKGEFVYFLVFYV